MCGPCLRLLFVGCCALWASLLMLPEAHCGYLGFSNAETSKYLLIGTGPKSFAFGVDVDNRALRGDIAITHSSGDIELSNVAVTGTVGIATTQSSYDAVTDHISNSTFNGSSFSSVNGISLNVNFDTLIGDLAQAETWIEGLSATQSFQTAKFTGDKTIVLQSGLNVIDLGIKGSDFLVENGTLSITQAAGVTDAVAVFRVVDKKFQTSNAKILADSSLGMHNVLFYNGVENQEAFNLSNIASVDVMGIRGVAFWALGDKAEININNGNGCTQLVADKINLNNVDLSLCAPPITVQQVPEPSSLILVLLGTASAGALHASRRRTSSKAAAKGG